ncbi:hypothetical protein [Actinoplanes sp. DH11]|uniref:hypothetical protein n=1 Tax=Actinoplanes sp. DH11 TaxID=2857011 RepID=UPI001E2AC77F|nr:hypothetical protein [Actinoplanes sp. DH11]
MPTDRVVALPGAEAGALALLIAGDHPDLAVVVSRPATAPAAPRDVVGSAVAELERVAVELLPAWLPDAAAVDRPDVSGWRRSGRPRPSWPAATGTRSRS